MIEENLSEEQVWLSRGLKCIYVSQKSPEFGILGPDRIETLSTGREGKE